MRSLAAACVVFGSACVPIDGGAVEVRWTIQNLVADSQRDEGARIDCQEAGIDTVNLRVDPEAADGRTYGFACEGGYGSTDFDVAPGSHLFVLEPGGRHGDDAIVPDAIAASVREGEVTDLQVLLIRVP